MRVIVATACTVVGFIALEVGLWLLSPWAGLAGTGALLLTVGASMRLEQSEPVGIGNREDA